MTLSDFKSLILEFYNESRAAATQGRFFSSLFSYEFTSNTEKVEMDVQRSIREIASDVVRGAGVGNQNYAHVFSSKEYTPPLYWEETPITASMLNKRIPGSNPYSDTGRMEAMAFLVGEAQAFNTNKILNAIELQAVQAFTNGIITLKNQVSLDFGKKATLNLVPSIKWDQTTANVEGDLGIICERVFQNGKRRPQTVVMDSLSFMLLKTRLTAKYQDSPSWIQSGLLAQGDVINGATYQGRLNGIPGYMLDVYVADDFYEIPGATIAAATTKTKYMPSYTVVVFDRTARFTKGFAAVEVIPQFEQEYIQSGLPTPPEMVAGQFVPFLYAKAPSCYMAGVQSAPLLIPTAIDCIGTIKSLNT